MQSRVRGLIARIAVECEGLVGPELADLCGLAGAYQAELARPFRIVGGRTQGLSTCGLVAEGIWYRAGIELPASWRPYAPRKEREKAIARAQTLGIARGAVVYPSPGKRPEMGDYVVIGTGLNTHALTCLGYVWDDDAQQEALESIDGGQVAWDGLQTIKLRTRLIDGSMVGNRAIQYWIDVDRI